MENEPTLAATKKFAIDDLDQSWSACIVEIILTKDQTTTAWCSKDHLLDEEVYLQASPDLLVSACQDLLTSLESINIETSLDDDTCGVIVLENKSEYYANMIRKALMTRIETWAVDKVHVLQNTSKYLDEYIAHRIGLLAYCISMPDETSNQTLTAKLMARGPVTLRGSDIQFKMPNCATSSQFAMTTIMPLRAGEIFDAELSFVRSNAMKSHDKHTAVESPTYRPFLGLRKSSNIFAEACRIIELHGYVCVPYANHDDFVQVKHPNHHVRKEAVENLLRARSLVLDDYPFKEFAEYAITFKTQGQYPPEQCAQRALSQLKTEIKDLEAMAKAALV